MHNVNEYTVKANGIHINYDYFGDPGHPAILLIMGLATQKIFWDSEFCQQLADHGFWVIRFDNRDIGKSTWMKEAKQNSLWSFMLNILLHKKIKSAYQLADMVADTLGLLDTLNINKAHVVGASMGGMIAQLLAIQAPERILSLTSIMSTTGDRSLPRATNSTLLKLLAAPAKNAQDYVAQGIKIWQLLHAAYYPFDRAKVTQLLQQSWQRGFNAAGVSRQLSAILASADRTAQLARLNLPALVIHGEEDPLLPLACGLATAKAIPRARLKVYAGMGHTIPRECVQEVVSDIITLCQSVDTSAVNNTP